MRLALVPRTTEFYGLFAAHRQNDARGSPPCRDPLSRDARAERRALSREGARARGRRNGRGDLRALEHPVHHSVRSRGHLRARPRRGRRRRLRRGGLGPARPLQDRSSDGAGDEQCRVLVEACAQLERASASLRNYRGIDEALRELKRLEDEGDRIARDAIASLFEDEDVSPRTMIRWKDVFEALERAIDACDTAGHIVGNIVLKNA